MGNAVNEKILAAFALEAHAHGVLLPRSKFTTAHNTLQAQWNKYIAATCETNSPLSMHMHFEVESEDIHVSISAASNVETLRMKPTIEALNKACKGLGWWVFETAQSANQDGYPIYRVRDYADFLQYDTPCSSFSDKGLIEEHNEYSGENIKTRLEYEDQYQAVWPSDLIKAVDGHKWLLCVHEYDSKTAKYRLLGKKPYIASLQEAINFLDGRAPNALKTIVKDFIALHSELNRPESLMKDASQPRSEDDEYLEPLGASCALVWDSYELPWHLIEHYEMRVQEGEYTDQNMVFKTDGINQLSLSKLVQSIKDFVTRHTTISKAFSHFEVIKT